MEIAFNLYYPDVFAIANSNVTFHQLVNENESLTKNAVETKVFLKKDSDVNSEIKVCFLYTLCSIIIYT